MALLNKGITLGQLSREVEAIAVYDDVVARFDGARRRRCANRWPRHGQQVALGNAR